MCVCNLTAAAAAGSERVNSATLVPNYATIWKDRKKEHAHRCRSGSVKCYSYIRMAIGSVSKALTPLVLQGAYPTLQCVAALRK